MKLEPTDVGGSQRKSPSEKPKKVGLAQANCWHLIEVYVSWLHIGYADPL
jgi:hypothetical protein